MGINYAELSMSLIRDARKNGQSENHLFKLVHRVHRHHINSGDGDKGDSGLPVQAFTPSGQRSRGTRGMVESFTRGTVGTPECPIGIATSSPSTDEQRVQISIVGSLPYRYRALL